MIFFWRGGNNLRWMEESMVFRVWVVRARRNEHNIGCAETDKTFRWPHYDELTILDTAGMHSQTRDRKVAGLSPVPGKTQQSGLKPNLSTNHLPTLPTTLPPSVSTTPSFLSSSSAPSLPAIASKALRCHPLALWFILHRFIPHASLSSIPLTSPSRHSIVVMKLEHRLILSVASYSSGMSFLNRIICDPVKRSCALDPVAFAKSFWPPKAASRARHSADVEESCQLGTILREKASSSWDTRRWEGSAEARMDDEFLDQ